MSRSSPVSMFFLFRGATPTEISTSFPTRRSSDLPRWLVQLIVKQARVEGFLVQQFSDRYEAGLRQDRKSTRLNSSHRCISYAVFCLKKKKGEKNCDHLIENQLYIIHASDKLSTIT